MGIIKAICFGITITVVSLYHGFKSKRQMTQIPPATSRAAIEGTLGSIVKSRELIDDVMERLDKIDDILKNIDKAAGKAPDPVGKRTDAELRR